MSCIDSQNVFYATNVLWLTFGFGVANMGSTFRAKLPESSQAIMEKPIRVTVKLKIADRNILRAAASYSNMSLGQLLADVAQQFREQFLQLRQNDSIKKSRR